MLSARGRLNPTSGSSMQAPSQGARIVVINDDTAFLDLMEELLEKIEGYRVETIKEWDGAFELVRDTRPDLVVLDIVLGHEERGWTILELLVLDPGTREIPVIVCSAAVRVLQEREAHLARYGVRALAKPFDLDDLLGTVRVMLAERGARPGDQDGPEGLVPSR
jgi:two-component system phosphate regulon response regulator PhoB